MAAPESGHSDALEHLMRSFQVDMDMRYFGGVVLKMCTSGEGQQKGQ